MKLIFLDFDGVLNSHVFLYEEGAFERQRQIENGREYKDLDESLEWYKAMIDERCIARLQKVIQNTSAKIVISSSWRMSTSLEKLIELLGSYEGIAKLEVIDRTPKPSEMPFYVDTRAITGSDDWTARGQEISRWLEINTPKLGPFESYVVLDDSSDAKYGHESNFVQTTWNDGLQDKHVERLIKILNRNDGNSNK